MSKNTLNKANLERLGAPKLAELVMELVRGSAALQRRARMELSAARGPEEVATDLRKRFASLRRSGSFVDRGKQSALVKNLNSLLTQIEALVAPHDADEAFELLWSFLQLAPSIHQRTDDIGGSVGEVFCQAVTMIELVAPRVTINPLTLAERILDAVADADNGEFDRIIPNTAEVLGPEGLEHLKQITKDWADALPTPEELSAYDHFGLSSSPADSVRDAKQVTSSIILADVADAQGDVDAYLARYSAEQLTCGTIATEVALRLTNAGRIQESYEILQRSISHEPDARSRGFNLRLDRVYVDCLNRLGKLDELKLHLWTRFEQSLSRPALQSFSRRTLRKYLDLLPDFDVVEAEETALDAVESSPHLGEAIHFLVTWPALDRVARVVLARSDELDGNDYTTLTHAAEALDAQHPLAAMLLRRAMVEDTLKGGKSARNRHAAYHLTQCQSSGQAITDYGTVQTHEDYVAALRQKYDRKYGFWSLMDS